MTPDDVDSLTERAWWVFDMGTSIVSVPANTEDDARNVLRRESHKNAPVANWPLICSRWTSRAALVRSLLGRPVRGGAT